MQNIGNKLEFLENILLAILFITMVIVIFIQVLNRSLMQLPISWTEELARYCMVCLTMIAAEIGLRDGSQIAAVGLTAWLPRVAQKILDIFANVVVIAFSSVVFFSSLRLIQRQIISGQTSPSLQLPMYIPYLSITVFMCIIAVVQTICLWYRVSVFFQERAAAKLQTEAGGDL